ncbi:MAG: hypothetical protein AAGB46_04820 [Verrucomicrobiota bacterium]
MSRRIPHSPFDAHVEKIKRLVQLEGIDDAEALSQRMGISHERIKGLADVVGLEIKNLQIRPVHRGRRAYDEHRPDMESLLRLEAEDLEEDKDVD